MEAEKDSAWRKGRESHQAPNHKFPLEKTVQTLGVTCRIYSTANQGNHEDYLSMEKKLWSDGF